MKLKIAACAGLLFLAAAPADAQVNARPGAGPSLANAQIDTFKLQAQVDGLQAQVTKLQASLVQTQEAAIKTKNDLLQTQNELKQTQADLKAFKAQYDKDRVGGATAPSSISISPPYHP